MPLTSSGRSGAGHARNRCNLETLGPGRRSTKAGSASRDSMRVSLRSSLGNKHGKKQMSVEMQDTRGELDRLAPMLDKNPLETKSIDRGLSLSHKETASRATSLDRWTGRKGHTTLAGLIGQALPCLAAHSFPPVAGAPWTATGPKAPKAPETTAPSTPGRVRLHLSGPANILRMLPSKTAVSRSSCFQTVASPNTAPRLFWSDWSEL